MAELQYDAVANADRSVTVTRSTGSAILTGPAAIVIDNAASKLDVWIAVRAALRALRRDSAKGTDPADFPTSGASVE